MSWLGKLIPPRINKSQQAEASTPAARRVPEGLWVKCPSCESVLYNEDLAANLHVCPKCDHHMRINARTRIESLLDIEGRVEIGGNTRSMDPLNLKTHVNIRSVSRRPLVRRVNPMRSSSSVARFVAWHVCSLALSSNSWAARWVQ